MSVSPRILAPLAAVGLLLSACDTAPTGETSGSASIQGRVTDDAASPTARRAAAPVEGAAVVAASVSASGSLRAMSGTATSGADGSFSLDTDVSADPVVLTATSGSFERRVLLEAGAAQRTRVQSAPMTSETDSEVGVFLAGRSASSASAADVAVFVTADVAADIRAGRSTEAEVAAALRQSLEAEAAYAEDGGVADDDAEDAREERDGAYASLRASLYASASTEAAEAAVASFEDAYAEAYVRAGASARTTAEAAQTRSRATAHFSTSLASQTAFAVQQRSRVLAAYATASAVEASFSARGTLSARLSALAEARRQLVAGLRAATTTAAMASAEAAYAASVKAELAGETAYGSSQITAASSASANASAAFEAAASVAASGKALAAAAATFYGATRSAVEAALGTGADASFTAEVVALVSVY